MQRRSSLILAWLVVVICGTWTASAAAQKIAIVPDQLELHGREGRHAILVHRLVDGEYGQQVRQDVMYQSSDPQVAVVADGIVIPLANGSTTVSATWGKAKASIAVTVSGMEKPHRWSFRNHVQSVLAKLGCNSGACHGTLAGKGGFKLSLRGYDTDRDYETITRQARGRRIELSDPGRSLLLAKPSGAIPHKGGLRFEVGSFNYRVIAEWIADGARGPSKSDAKLERLEVLPAISRLQPGDKQKVTVRAHFNDGHVEDVTRWAKLASTNEAVARMSDDGELSVIGHGEGAVTAWYASKIVIARITSPYKNSVPAEVYAKAPRRNFIDGHVLRQLQRLNLPPSSRADDGTFMRRAFLDTIGVLPTPDEVRSFLADNSPNKRDRLIDHLLTRPEFVDYWTYKWSDMLLINGTRLRPTAVKSYYKWIFKHVKSNTPWDQFVREIVTARGSSFDNGATNFYALHQDPEGMTENVSQAFLGLSIGCAKCHNHPLEKWTNDQYYAMANMFARVRAKGWGGDPRSGDGRRTLYVVPKGDLIQPLRGRPQPPTPLDGQALAFNDPTDRREHLAKWLTAPDNPYFARAIANRVWANFFGVGLIESVDDMRISNPASNEQLLQATADYVVQNKFNLRALMRVILQSEAYQRSSQPLVGNKDEHRFYSRFYPRRLMAEVMLDAISKVTDVPSQFNEIAFPGADRRKTDFYPIGTRALQLYDSAVSSYFLKTFGRNARAITCECERSDEPSMVQVLHISNGNTINEKLRAKGNRIDLLLDQDRLGEAVDEVYLAALSRFPTKDEKKELVAMLAQAPAKEKRLAMEDLFWAVMSSREFLFNH